MPISVSTGNCSSKKGEKAVFQRPSKYTGRPDLLSVFSRKLRHRENPRRESHEAGEWALVEVEKKMEKRSFKWYQAWTCIWMKEAMTRLIQKG